MSTYELTIISKSDAKTTTAITAKVKGWIEAAKGKIEKTDPWGVKLFAYPIKKMSEGFYTLFLFSCDSKDLGAIEKRLHLESEIVRYLLIVK